MIMKMLLKSKSLFALHFCVLVGLVLLPIITSATEYRVVEIPKEFKAVKFSQDGEHVAFSAEKDGKFCAVVDGKEGPLYEDITVVEFSPQGNHYYYGGKRAGKWYLVRDGKEIAKLGGLTSLNQATGLNYMGGQASVTIWSNLPIWFAKKAENYFVLCYQNNTGKIFKDGSWLSVEFRSFWHEGMALSPDGKHYSFAVSPFGSSQPKMYIDGVPGPKMDNIDGATYLQPGNRLVYRRKQDGNWILMEGDKALDGYGPLVGIIKVSPDHMHLAALIKKEGGKQVVVVNGKEETAFPRVDWGYTGFLSSPGSFTWNKKFSSHAYVAYLTSEKTSPRVVVHNGKSLSSYSEIRGSSLSISDDGTHVAYVTKNKDKWAVVVDNVAQESFEEIGNPVFVGSGGKVVYTAKSLTGWVVKGISDSPVFLDVGPLVRGPNNKIAYAAKIDSDKWRIFVDSKPVSRPFDGIVAQTGIQFESSGSIRFVANDGGKLIWIKIK